MTVLLENYRREHRKTLKPVKRRGGKTVPPEAVCPYCGTPPEYAYDNNGGSSEFWCKVCNSKFSIQKPTKDDDVLPVVDLPNISASSHVLGLILTYHINYGLPLRKTAAIMYDVHGIKVSHQTVANYCHAVAPRVKPFVDGFDYELSDSFCGDETYIKIKGIWHHIFFFFDATSKLSFPTGCRSSAIGDPLSLLSMMCW